ncbi:MAG: type II toxin-antitoxin system VapC family toxin [Actinobacteria bacterium]|nr:type II toxin-antitoxin system VapC family toxin [Actinomycetota bacterium]
MVVDTSALVAIVANESEAPRCAEILAFATDIAVSSVTVVEAGIVLESRHGAAAGAELDELLAMLGVRVVSVGADHVAAARQAYRLFGKGRHPAGLNFGDCFSYVLAQTLGAPLLFLGGDFSRTDVTSALD